MAQKLLREQATQRNAWPKPWWWSLISTAWFKIEVELRHKILRHADTEQNPNKIPIIEVLRVCGTPSPS